MIDDYPIIAAHVLFADGRARPVYQQPDGRQFVIGDDGDPVYGVWYMPRDEADQPVIVEGTTP